MTANASRSPGLTLRISNDLDAIAFARIVIRHVLPPLDDMQDSLYFGALTEIVTNAIQEHRRSELDSEVQVRVDTSEQVCVTVTDSGAGFDPSATPVSTDESGLGLLISRAVVPSMAVTTSSDGTSVSLPYPLDDV